MVEGFWATWLVTKQCGVYHKARVGSRLGFALYPAVTSGNSSLSSLSLLSCTLGPLGH